MEEIVVGIDVGTTKICTLVGRVEDGESIRILGVGIEPSDGIRKGIVVDLAAATQAITRSVKKAESTSGLEITSALVSIAGSHVSSVNSRGAVAVNGKVIELADVDHAMEQARAVAIPHDRSFVQALNAGQPRALREEPQPSPSLAALTELARQVEERLAVIGNRK